jgi:hypothetical protein
MSRTMYDAVSWQNIPADAEMVAGYVDGPASQWPAEAWARFPHAVTVRITVNPADNEGDVLDVENGDAEPADAPGWIKRRHAAGAKFVTIYCNRSTLPAVQAAAQGTEYSLWISTLDGTQQVAGAVAVQYQGGPHAPYDVSVVHDDSWHPAAGPAPKPPGPSDLGGDWAGQISVRQWPGVTVLAGIMAGCVHVTRQAGPGWSTPMQVSNDKASSVSLLTGPGGSGQLFYVNAANGHLIRLATSDMGQTWT